MGLLFVPVWLANAQFFGGFDYTTNSDGTLNVSAYTGPGGIALIPGAVGNLPVTSIGPWAFYAAGVSTVFIPDSVTNISDGAFFDCASLTNVTVGAGVTNIGDWALAFCPGLTAVDFRGNPPSLGGADVFYGDSATAYYLPTGSGWTATFDGFPTVLWNPSVPFNYSTNNGTITVTRYVSSDGTPTIPPSINFLPVTAIGPIVFERANLSSVTIPICVTNFGIAAFADCTNLAALYFQGSAPGVGANMFVGDSHATAYYLPAVAGWGPTFDGLPTAPFPFGYVTNAAAISVTAYTGVSGYVSVPGTINNLPVTSITPYLFSGLNLTNVALPNGLTNIGNFAFFGCSNLMGVLIPNSVTSIGQSAFEGCVGLTSVAIPAELTSLSDAIFERCSSLISITIPNGVTNIGSNAFFDCVSLTGITLPDSIATVGTGAFSSCVNLAAAYFQGAPPIPESSVFTSDESATIYYLPASAGWGATFDGLPTALFPFVCATNNDAISITAYTGPGGDVPIPGAVNGLPVTDIGSQAFWVCTNLISVTIPASVTNIEGGAFSFCSNLIGVYFQGNAPPQSNPGGLLAFWQVYKATAFYTQGTTGWGTSFDGLPALLWNSEVLSQLAYATNEGGIVITAYDGDGGAVTMPSTIGALPVTAIADGAFANSTGLTSITFPAGLESIGDDAFFFCTNLSSFTIPGTVTNLGNFTFVSCTGLTNVVLPSGVTNIGEDAFFSCTGLTNVTVPGSVASISDRAFQDCPNLDAIYFQGNAPAVVSTIFSGDENVTNYYLPKTAGWGPTLAGKPAVPILFTYTTNGAVITITKYIGIYGDVTVPNTINKLPVGGIAGGAFYQCDTLTNIFVGYSVNNIGGQAFTGCSNLLTINVDPLNPAYSSLDGVLFDKNRTILIQYPNGRAGDYSIPDGVTTIGGYAFQDCSMLANLIIPDSVTSIEGLAFNYCTNLTALFFEGNQPDADFAVFLWYDSGEGFVFLPNATVYYLPGTTGWGQSYAGLLSLVWNARISSVATNFGIRTNQFGFPITGISGPAVVEACTNVANPNWVPIATNAIIRGSSYFADPQWINFPTRFYRVIP